MTPDEVLALPVTVDLLTSANALGISRNMAYEMAKRDEYPVKVYRVGNRYRVVRAELISYLGLTRIP